MSPSVTANKTTTTNYKLTDVDIEQKIVAHDITPFWMWTAADSD